MITNYKINEIDSIISIIKLNTYNIDIEINENTSISDLSDVMKKMSSSNDVKYLLDRYSNDLDNKVELEDHKEINENISISDLSIIMKKEFADLNDMMKKMSSNNDIKQLLDKHSNDINNKFVLEEHKGVKHSIPKKEFADWNIHYEEPYSQKTTSDNIDPKKGTYMFVGAYTKERPDEIYLGAYGLRSEVKHITNNKDEAKEHNGV
jgi:hypothetical protein